MNDDSLVTAENWMVILNNALYTAIDFNTQLILVSVLNIQIFLASIYVFFNEALPVLDHVAPTIGHGYPMHFITCIFRC